MESVRVRQHIGNDGILHLEIPVGVIDREVEVMVIYQPVQVLVATASPLAQLYGVCANDPISLDTQGVAETLDDDLTGAFD
ncbi:hypothetical protein D0962_14030 [Leptolyngbyaceae cyanobacterium CCMR0082]|uniref:Uncharacterized protein n=1 Tax=Adonisia turfae CCMR0082 TaxID=2304604 RepID=A0A6M0S7V5_9CYAN|nr:hypothetical protein [Adonisia turfae]NEZ63892.1 hypothetical protein [Adonisia turfae CCMR0082]